MNPIYLVTDTRPGEQELLKENQFSALKIMVTDGSDQDQVFKCEPSKSIGWTHELIDQVLSESAEIWYVSGHAYDAYLDNNWIGSTEC